MRVRFGVWVLIVMLSTTAHAAAQTSCAALVDSAVNTVGNNCLNLAIGQACYGFEHMEPTFADDVNDTVFGSPAHRTDTSRLQGVTTLPVNETQTAWGVAALGIADAANVGTVFLVMGDTSLQGVDDTFADFRFRTNPDETLCHTEAPSLVALRTLDNTAANLQINGETVRVSGVVTLRWQSPNSLAATVHRGQLELTSRDTQAAQAGETLSAVIDNDGNILFWSAPSPADDTERAAASPVARLYTAMGFPTEITPAGCTYTVQEGDTLYKIGRRYGQTVDEIAAANNITNPDVISAGQVLTVPCVEVENVTSNPAPAPGNTNSTDTEQATCDFTYVFESDDTLQGIASIFGTSADAIANANDFAPGQVPGIGQDILIPCAP